VLFKHTTDIAAVGDILAKQLNYSRFFGDTSAAGDLTVKTFDKLASDVLSLTDTVQIEVARIVNLADSFFAGDIAIRSYSKRLADLFQAQDGALVSVQKGAAETVVTGELVSRAQALGKQESVSVASSGTLRSQSYGDMSYFAEDYVGSSRSFT
jgi:hypothetical protein